MNDWQAVEFFSGIGAFAQTSRARGITVLQAFDQNPDANKVYSLNTGHQPTVRNLDTVRAADVAQCDLWWMSPPCKPYSIRGKQKDDEDRRAASLKNLIELLPVHTPQIIMLENVVAFRDSQMHKRLVNALERLEYTQHQLELCPTMFGVPMRRPRFFLIAIRSQSAIRFDATAIPNAVPRRLSDYLQTDSEIAAELYLTAETFDRYQQGFDIVDVDDDHATAICFTSGYFRCMKASGSMLRDANGRVRRFSPREMLNLLGFPDAFKLPEDLPLARIAALIGNSVDTRCISFLLDGLKAGEASALPCK
jgi:DNA (cytosine-5)-methyltransferase 1